MKNSLCHLRVMLNARTNCRNRHSVQKPFLLARVENARIHGTAVNQVSCSSTARLQANHPRPHLQVDWLRTSNLTENRNLCVEDVRLMQWLEFYCHQKQLEYGQPDRSRRHLAGPHQISDTSERKLEQLQNVIWILVEDTRLNRMRKCMLVKPFYI